VSRLLTDVHGCADGNACVARVDRHEHLVESGKQFDLRVDIAVGEQGAAQTQVTTSRRPPFHFFEKHKEEIGEV
jgi:hypothetical protein